MMKLLLQRKYFKDKYTIGDLAIDGAFFSNTIEDKVRDLSKEKKVFGETAIPNGEYRVILSMSKRFQKVLPEILNVPQFEGVRIHSGNYATQTEGCVIVGQNKIKGGVINSKITLDKLMDKLKAEKDITITIV